jgi:hypothetical protein
MDFPDEWQNYPANGGPDPVPGAWSSGLSDTLGQSSSSSVYQTTQIQPQFAPSQHGIPQYKDPILPPPSQDENQGSEAVNQDNNSDGDADWYGDQIHNYVSLGPAPLSGSTGSAFNKARHVYSSHVPKLMADEEIEQSRSFERYRLHSIRFELSHGDVLVFIDYPNL